MVYAVVVNHLKKEVFIGTFETQMLYEKMTFYNLSRQPIAAFDSKKDALCEARKYAKLDGWSYNPRANFTQKS